MTENATEQGDEEFDPADYNIPDVNAYVEDNPDDAQRVLDAEKARGDSARSSLVSALEKQLTPVDPPKAVEVSPTDASVQTVSFFGKEYEVTADGGHKMKS